jgi:hypothetical protein
MNSNSATDLDDAMIGDFSQGMKGEPYKQRPDIVPALNINPSNHVGAINSNLRGPSTIPMVQNSPPLTVKLGPASMVAASPSPGGVKVGAPPVNLPAIGQRAAPPPYVQQQTASHATSHASLPQG